MSSGRSRSGGRWISKTSSQLTIRSLEGSPRASEQEARNLAGAFLFTGEEQDKALGDLSGGERGRLVLASLIASAKNLLVLDEPTASLPGADVERLFRAIRLLKERGVAILYVSHHLDEVFEIGRASCRERV